MFHIELISVASFRRMANGLSGPTISWATGSMYGHLSGNGQGMRVESIGDKIRVAVAGTAGLIGGCGFLLGVGGLLYARLTGSRDPIHHGAMLAGSAAFVFLASLPCLLVAVIIWPWRRHRSGPARLTCA